ncbi:MAG: hypothetical protein LQ345_000708 [Seirophora villosa]|nr:MAG: hypothetical protein LQ345_000708 [Seirophora villosa]
MGHIVHTWQREKFFLRLLVLSHLIASVLSCADHTNRQRGHLSKRQEDSSTNSSSRAANWAYDASYNWGALEPSYADCQTGTQQSPIALSLTNGLSQYHHPTFENYDRNVSGNWTNWGYGPSFNLAHPPDNYTTLPSLRWDNETAYLKGWHIHAPADHSVGGDRSKAEMHLVHVDTEGDEVAVLAIRLDPGTSMDPFFAQLPKMIPFVTGPGLSPDQQFSPAEVVEDVPMNMALILNGVYRFNEFWTYKGSLTSPPCREGIRWFVARTIAFTAVNQMKTILGACTFSAREEQEVWLHEINSA